MQLYKQEARLQILIKDSGYFWLWDSWPFILFYFIFKVSSSLETCNYFYRYQSSLQTHLWLMLRTEYWEWVLPWAGRVVRLLLSYSFYPHEDTILF